MKKPLIKTHFLLSCVPVLRQLEGGEAGELVVGRGGRREGGRPVQERREVPPQSEPVVGAGRPARRRAACGERLKNPLTLGMLFDKLNKSKLNLFLFP